jgi:hypothetical protein
MCAFGHKTREFFVCKGPPRHCTADDLQRGPHSQRVQFSESEGSSQLPISAGKGVGAKELGKIEAIVRQQIADALPVFARDAPLAEARKIVGLRAVFGEVSGGTVCVQTSLPCLQAPFRCHCLLVLMRWYEDAKVKCQEAIRKTQRSV